jgi:spore coat protein U-like protein
MSGITVLSRTNMNKSFRLMAAGALVTLAMPMAAWAQVAVNVSVNVQGSCAVSAPVDAARGNFTPTQTSQTIAWTGAVTLRCNAGASPQVAVNLGQNAGAGTQRFMVKGSDQLAYAIYKPTLNGTDFTTCPAAGVAGTPWGFAGTDRLAASGAFATGGDRTVNLCVQATITDVMPIGSYTDQVLVSVGF